jgi:tRNA threonylcarbamoyladenosine biosynthesis protein TsaB
VSAGGPVLIIDTCLAACQVAAFDGARQLAAASEPMERGHQERLATMAAEVMAAAALAFADLGKIAVTIGPGSFTGLRVGLAFARGLAMAAGAPLAGIGTLHALAASGGDGGVCAGVIDARRGLVYVQAFDGDAPLMAPDVLPIGEAMLQLARLGPGPLRLVGPGARLLAHGLRHAVVVELAAPDLAALGRLALAAEPDPALRPLYLRAPDAKLPA